MPFINCSKTGNDLSTVLDILENNSDLLLTGVDAVVDVLDDFVTDELMSSTQEVENAIKAVDDGIFDIIPDYTNRLNNSGAALERYDDDFREFKELLKNCPQAKLRQFMGNLELGIDFPDLPDIDFPFFEYSAVRQALRDITEFPLSYLTSVKQEILNNTLGGIGDLAGGLKEFITGAGLDDLEALMPSKILDIAQNAEYLINCAESIVCSDLVQQVQRYESIMSPLPLDPPFQITTGTKLARIPRYKLDTPGILSTSKAGPGQVINLQNAKTSVTSAMNYTRTITSKF
jgi:hypothetical protein